MAPPFTPPVPEPLLPFGAVRPPGVFAVTSPYGKRLRDVDGDGDRDEEWHRALDMGNGQLGAPITTPAPGKVIAEGYLREPWSESSTAFGTGNFAGICVAIDHGNGWYSLLAHLRQSIVNAGQTLLPHQLIGYLGDTGSAKGAGHVHWDLYHGRPTTAMTYAQRQALTVDPWPLLEQNYTLPDTGTTEPDMLAEKTTFRTTSFRARLLPGTAFRSDTRIADDTLIDRTPSDGNPVVELTVIGSAEGDTYQNSNIWWVYGINGRGLGCFHSKTATALDPEDRLQAALDAANQRSGAIKAEAVASLKNVAVIANSKADAISKL